MLKRILNAVCGTGRRGFSLLAAGMAVALAASAADVRADPLPARPFAEDYLLARISAHSFTFSSRTNPQVIPARLYYKQAYKEILSRPDLLENLPAADLRLISTLPAHTAPQFTRQSHHDMERLCLQAAQITDDQAEIQALAWQLEETRLSHERVFDIHYAGVHAALSAQTAELVDRLVRQYIDDGISYTAFDFSGFAIEQPQVALSMINSSCDEFSQMLSSYTPREGTLKDELERRLLAVDQTPPY